jgi:hypothetical protein
MSEFKDSAKLKPILSENNGLWAKLAGLTPKIQWGSFPPVIGLMLGINEVIFAKEVVKDTELCKE